MPASSCFLQTVGQADNFPIPLLDTLSHVLQSPNDQHGPHSLRPWSIPLHLHPSDMSLDLTPIGWIRPHVRKFLEYDWPGSDLGEPIIEFSICRPLQRPGTIGNCYQDGPEFAYLCPKLLKGGYEMMTREMNRLMKYLKDRGLFDECLQGWRDEKYEIYASDRSRYFQEGGQGSSTSGAM